MKYLQVTPPRPGTLDGLGWCLRFSQSALSAPVAYPSARKAWDGQKGRHFDRPPRGIAVPIWFDHWGTYGSPAYYDNWGHVAIWLGDGRVLSSPLRNSQLSRWDPAKGEMVGQGIYDSIEAVQRDLGGSPNYLGWSEYMNGKQIVAESNGSTSGQEEEEDMKGIIYRAEKYNAPQGVYAGPTGGFVVLANAEERSNLSKIGTPEVWLTAKTLDELIKDARKGK